METLYYLELAVNLLIDSLLFFCFFLRNLTGLDLSNYWLQIIEVPKFYAKVRISMVLGEVFEALGVVDLDSGPISLIDDVFVDVCKVRCLHDDLLEVFVLTVYSID